MKAGHTSLHVTIRQGDDCDAIAVVRFWRVTHCTQAASEEEARKHYYDDDAGVAGSGNGSDDAEDDNDDDEFYYYDEAVKSGKSQAHTKCTNKLYTLGEGRTDFMIEGLSECTMYTVDLSPADASGHVLQPGEDYGSVHSTFCSQKNHGSSDQSSNFFFENTKGKSSLVKKMLREPGDRCTKSYNLIQNESKFPSATISCVSSFWSSR